MASTTKRSTKKKVAPEPIEHVLALAVANIVPGDNDRCAFDEQSLKELGKDMLANGQVQPIVVRWRPQIRHYEIVAGERRWRAARLVGMSGIKAIVRDLTDEEASRQMLAENLQRRDLNPIDEAHGYRKRMERFGLSLEEVAAWAGVAPFRVRWRLDLLRLHPTYADFVASGQMDVGFARAMSDLEHAHQQVVMDKLRQAPSMSVNTWKRICAEQLMKQQEMPLFELENEVIDDEPPPQRTAAKTFTRDAILDCLSDLLVLVDGLGIDPDLSVRSHLILDAEGVDF